MKSRGQIIAEVSEIAKELDMLGLLKLLWCARAIIEIENENKGVIKEK